MIQRAREVRARLWSPPGGIVSSDLDVVSSAEFRRRLIAEQREAARAARLRSRTEAIATAAAQAAAWRAEHEREPTIFDAAGPKRQCREIAKACCRHFGIRGIDIVAKRRTKDITYPRQVAMYLMAEHTTCSFPEIGRQFGGFDHTSVLHNWKKIKTTMPTDDRVQADVDAVRLVLGIGGNHAD